MKDEKSEFLDTAFRAAILSGEIILKNLGEISRKDIGVKQASDFVTRIDTKSEEIIIRTIRKTYPDHHFLAEESLKEAEEGNYRWIIDPLDGTTNYIHGYPMFAVSIALQHKGDIILGIVFDPVRNEMFSAEKNNGAFLNGKPLKRLSDISINDSLIATGFPFRKKDFVEKYLELFKRVFDKVSDIRRAGSAALDLAYIACGRCDGFFEIGLSPWDIAAGSLLIKEVGGNVTDFDGRQDYFTTGNIVAGVPGIHSELMKNVKDVFGEVLKH
jgi:myo-inositol-1(or 4)-monophosphatase